MGNVFSEAFLVNGMAAAHEDDGLGACLEVVGADGAVDVQTLGAARVGVLVLDGDAGLTNVAVMIIDAQALADTTDAAAVAVVNVLARGVVVEAAVGAKVGGELGGAGAAVAGDGLDLCAADADDLLGGVAIDLVVLVFVVAAAAGVEAAAAVGLEPAVARVVVTAGVGALAREAAVVGVVGVGGVGGVAEEEAAAFGVEGVDALGLLVWG